MKKESIVTAVFEEENVAYKALSKLKEEEKSSGYKIKQLGLMTKTQGHLIPIHGFDMKNKSKKAATKGGVIGALIGLFSGPIGLLVGAGLGATIGHSARRKGTTLSTIGLIDKTMEKMPDDQVILIALTNEEDEAVMSSKLQRYNAASVKSFSVELLCYEIKEAKKLEKKMKKEKKKKAKSEPEPQSSDDEIWGQREE